MKAKMQFKGWRRKGYSLADYSSPFGEPRISRPKSLKMSKLPLSPILKSQGDLKKCCFPKI